MQKFNIQSPDTTIVPLLIDKINNLTKPKGSLGPGVKMRRAVPVVLLHGKSMRRKGIDSSHQHMVCQPFHQGISFRPAIVSENLTKRPALFVRLDMGCGASQLCQSEMEKFAVPISGNPLMHRFGKSGNNLVIPVP